MFGGIAHDLLQGDGATRVSLSQDNNASEAEAKHSAGNWQVTLDGLKEVVEES